MTDNGIAAPLAGDTKTSQDRGWSVLAQAAGGLTGAAALIYAVGALIMWIRFNLMHWPATIVLQHVSNTAIVRLGAEALVSVAAIEALVLVIFLWILNRLAKRRTTRPLVRSRATAITIAMLVIGATINAGSWTALGLFLLFTVALLILGVYEERLLAGRTAPTSVLVIVLAIATGLSATCVSVANKGFAMDEVKVTAPNGAPKTPLPSAPAKLTDFPYLGESDGYIFLPEVYKDRDKHGLWTYTGRVLTVRRDEYDVSFPNKTLDQSYPLRPPSAVASSAVKRVWHYVTTTLF